MLQSRFYQSFSSTLSRLAVNQKHGSISVTCMRMVLHGWPEWNLALVGTWFKGVQGVGTIFARKHLEYLHLLSSSVARPTYCESQHFAKRPHNAIIDLAGRTGHISFPRKISRCAGKSSNKHAKVFRRFRSRFLPLQAFVANQINQLTCFMLEIPNSTCATNLTSECLCADAALNAAVGACASKTCSVYELLRKRTQQRVVVLTR